MVAIAAGVSALTVFIQGLLSFFSPCVLPLVPLYLAYLSGLAQPAARSGSGVPLAGQPSPAAGTSCFASQSQLAAQSAPAVRYKRSRVMLNTAFFVLGISFAFFVLGFGFSALGRFFAGSQRAFSIAAGILIILFGLYQLSPFSLGALNRERRLPFRLERFAMGPAVALALGFTFSFAWTPCVGPALTSVLLMASGAGGGAVGWLLIGLYTLGFTLPFLAVGLFAGTLLDLFKKHQKALKYTVKIGGALMVLMGVMTLTGWMGGLTASLAGLGGPAGGGAPPAAAQSQSASASRAESIASSAPGSTPAPAGGAAASAGGDEEKIPAPDFTLADQFGESHTLSGYRGQVVFLNFWATWCPPCRQEMPDVEALYQDGAQNTGDYVVLGVANPKTDTHPQNQDGTAEEVAAFLADGGYSYPTVMDNTGEVFAAYGIQAFPTTFIIDPEGNVLGYAPGMLSRAQMDQIIALGLEE